MRFVTAFFYFRPMQKAIQVIIHGRVQGVGFRYFTCRKAEEMDLVGHVKNLEDGTVFIEACGNTNQIEHFIKWCKIGSPSSEVSQVDIEEIPNFEADQFQIRRKHT